MKLLSVNVSLPKEIEHQGKTVTTGIFKEPVDRRVLLRKLNLDGDGQADLIGHGGEFKAVYVYSAENYAYWEKELGRTDFIPGQFGENFTVEGMPDDGICVGDVYRVGEALVQVTQPRVPCYKLAIKMRIDGFQNVFLSHNRVGFYLRVLEEGEVGAGDGIERIERAHEGMPVDEVNDFLYFDLGNIEATRKALRIEELSSGWQGSFEARLAKAKSTGKVQEGYRTLIVDKKLPESEIITSFYLVPEDGKELALYCPGQFLPLRLDIPGEPKPLNRTYTLSDSPNPDYYRLSIKRELPPPDQPDLPPGRSSNFFHDRVEVGTKLRVKSPRGKFYLDPKSERPVALISAGVGLTPMVSMLNAIVGAGSSRPTWFIHGARSGREHAFGDHVRRVAKENDHVRVLINYSQPQTEDIQGKDYDGTDFINTELLKQVLPDLNFDFFFCGPPPFMKSLFNELSDLGSRLIQIQ